MAWNVPAGIGALFGVAASAAWLGLFAVAVASYPGYDVWRNNISDLGHPLATAAWPSMPGASSEGSCSFPT